MPRQMLSEPVQNREIGRTRSVDDQEMKRSHDYLEMYGPEHYYRHALSQKQRQRIRKQNEELLSADD